MLESGVEAAEEHSVRRARQVVSKCPHASTSQGEPNPKKAKKGSEAKRASTSQGEPNPKKAKKGSEAEPKNLK